MELLNDYKNILMSLSILILLLLQNYFQNDLKETLIKNKKIHFFVDKILQVNQILHKSYVNNLIVANEKLPVDTIFQEVEQSNNLFFLRLSELLLNCYQNESNNSL